MLHKTGKQITIWVNFKGGKISYFKAAIILKFSMCAIFRGCCNLRIKIYNSGNDTNFFDSFFPYKTGAGNRDIPYLINEGGCKPLLSVQVAESMIFSTKIIAAYI